MATEEGVVSVEEGCFTTQTQALLVNEIRYSGFIRLFGGMVIGEVLTL